MTSQQIDRAHHRARHRAHHRLRRPFLFFSRPGGLRRPFLFFSRPGGLRRPFLVFSRSGGLRRPFQFFSRPGGLRRIMHPIVYYLPGGRVTASMRWCGRLLVICGRVTASVGGARLPTSYVFIDFLRFLIDFNLYVHRFPKDFYICIQFFHRFPLVKKCPRKGYGLRWNGYGLNIIFPPL